MNSDRIDHARQVLTERNVEALVLTSPSNRRWATGFTSYAGTSFSGDVAIITPSTVELLVAAIHVGWAKGEAPIATSVTAHSGAFASSLVEYLAASSLANVAIEADFLPYPDAKAIKKAFGGEITFVTSLRDQFRIVKDSTELASLTEAVRVTDQVLEEIAAGLTVGQTEQELARKISSRLFELGGGLAFDAIVASGPNAARPHHRPGDRAIQVNESIIIDMGARIDGYCGDLTRTLWLGEPDEKFVAVYQAVLAAQVATKLSMTAGTPVKDVAIVADTSLQKSGYGEYILHSVGHGVGLEIHESPAVRRDLDSVLRLGSVVTVEPGVYIPDWGGVRIEDVVVIGEQECRTLTGAAKLAFS